jgi:energy-coupling factor transporter ATP-binding protein EcfA2
MRSPAIRLDALSIWRGKTANAKPVLSALSLNVERGERVALIGANGAGKTSLLLALLGAVPYDGSIQIDGELLDRDNLSRLRQKLGFVFSDPQDQLFLPSVREEVAFGPVQRGVQGPELEARVNEALACVKLAGFEQRAPSELSLGEQRRLAIASVLSCRPPILLLDEPTASLDPRARRRMLETLADLDATILCATHDLDAALDLAARVIVLAAGKIVADGPADRVLRDAALLDEAALELPLCLGRGAR